MLKRLLFASVLLALLLVSLHHRMVLAQDKATPTPEFFPSPVGSSVPGGAFPTNPPPSLPSFTPTPFPPAVTPEPTRTKAPLPPAAATSTGGPASVGGRIAFHSNREGNYEIYTLDSSGGSLERLTFTAGASLFPSWSPDGTRLIYEEDGVLTIINADGSSPTPVSSASSSGSDYDPAWSPDGRQVVFFSARDAFDDLYLLDLDSGSETRLTSGAGQNRYPEWSPDGTRIVFNSNRDGSVDLYILTLAGSTLQRVTATDGADEFTPAWSPDGSMLAFAASYDGNDFEIYTLPVPPPDAPPLTNPDALRLTDNGGDDFYPAWSPDGQVIVYHTIEAQDVTLYIVPAAGGEARRLTEPGSTNGAPDWGG